MEAYRRKRGADGRERAEVRLRGPQLLQPPDVQPVHLVHARRATRARARGTAPRRGEHDGAAGPPGLRQHRRARREPLERYIGLAALQDRNEHLFYRCSGDHLEEFLPDRLHPDRGPGLPAVQPDLPARARAVDHARAQGPDDRGARQRPLRGRAAHRRHRQRAHPRPRRPGRGRHGHPDRQALALHGRGRDPPRADPPGQPRRRHRQQGPARRRPLPRLAPARGCAARPTTRWSTSSCGRSSSASRRRSCSGRTSSSGTPSACSSATARSCPPSTTTSRARPRWRWPGSSPPRRAAGRPLVDQRVVIAGAGAAGVGIAGCFRSALAREGVTRRGAPARVALLDSKGLVVDAQDEYRRRPRLDRRAGLRPRSAAPAPSLLDVVRAAKPTILVGVSGVPGLVRRGDRARRWRRRSSARRSSRCRTRRARPRPGRWTSWPGPRGARSSRPAARSSRCEIGGRTIRIGQGNNAFIFPGVGLGVLVSEAREVTDGDVRGRRRRPRRPAARARTCEAGSLFPRIAGLRAITARVAAAVVRQAVTDGVARNAPEDPAEAIAAAMWDPVYPAIDPDRSRVLGGSPTRGLG